MTSLNVQNGVFAHRQLETFIYFPLNVDIILGQRRAAAWVEDHLKAPNINSKISLYIFLKFRSGTNAWESAKLPNTLPLICIRITSVVL